MRSGVGDLAADVADAVRGGQRRDRDRAQRPQCSSVLVQEGGAGVTGDAGGERVGGVAPAAGRRLDDDAVLGAEQRDALPERGVAVACRPARRPRRCRPRSVRRRSGIDGLTLADVGGVDPDQREVVVGAGLLVRLAVALHRQPGVVGEGPRTDAPSMSTLVPSGSDAEVQPSVSVAAPVDEQWAAWPM